MATLTDTLALYRARRASSLSAHASGWIAILERDMSTGTEAEQREAEAEIVALTAFAERAGREGEFPGSTARAL